jgi:hypothetical protein
MRLELVILVGHESPSDETFEEGPGWIVSAKVEAGFRTPILGLASLLDGGGRGVRSSRGGGELGVGEPLVERVS